MAVLRRPASVLSQVAKRMNDSGLHTAAQKHEEHANNLDKEVSIVRDLILYGFAPNETSIRDKDPNSGITVVLCDSLSAIPGACIL